MTDENPAAIGTTRRGFLSKAGWGAAGLLAPAYLKAKGRHDGTTINAAMFSHGFVNLLRPMLPQFKEETGITVNLVDKAFPIYNQQTDLELATGGASLDVISISFIYTARWIGSGFMEPLDRYLGNPELTPADWGRTDFVEALQKFGRSADGKVTYGIPWEAGVWLMAAGRGDLMDKAGLANGGIPASFDELKANCARLKALDPSVAPFISDTTHHVNYPMYLQGMGAQIFKDPPNNLTPLLDKPVAAAAAEMYAGLLRDHGPQGVLSMRTDQVAGLLRGGQANYWHYALPWLVNAAKGDSAIAKTVRFGEVPGGSAGRFPSVVTHSLGIPKFSRKKDASWEFIRWAMSPAVQRRMAIEQGYAATTRTSILRDPAFVKSMTINGTNIAALVEKVLADAEKKDYMNYRIVSVFPIIGGHINSAIQKIASGQATGAEAMAKAQSDILVDFKKNQVKVDA
ncbi:ABC transporter substrate-binding protein [Piscinibacter sakaiensis]|uniref:ABC transporter substrate-binding protein n=1 Tax=Piscinibacter sakaiensis TaxID=1547922 RepID=UPI003AAEB514